GGGVPPQNPPPRSRPVTARLLPPFPEQGRVAPRRVRGGDPRQRTAPQAGDRRLRRAARTRSNIRHRVLPVVPFRPDAKRQQAAPRSKARPVRVPVAVRPPRRARARVHPPRVAPPPPPRRRNGGRCHPGGPRQ